MKRPDLCPIIAALVVGSFFVWHGEWAARGFAAKAPCAALGYQAVSVDLFLRPYCVAYGNGGEILIPVKRASDDRPGEVDG